MENNKIMLINAPNRQDSNTSGNYAAFPAIGVVSLGTRLQQDYPALEVRVVDGGVRTTDYIKGKIDEIQPSIVGISVLTPTYSEGLELARYAKEHYGSTVVLGNDHASFFPELILQNRAYVDYVVRAEIGEIPLSYIVGKEREGKVQYQTIERGEEEVYFRTSAGIQKVAFPKLLLPQVYGNPEDIPNLELIADDIVVAKASYNEKYGHLHQSERTPVVVNNVRGCGNGEKRCTYCSIYDLSLNVGNPKFFWKTVERYNKKYGINFFFEVCDSFLTFQRYVKQLVETMPFDPKQRDIEFEVYARANDVVNVPDAVSWLRMLNVTRVNLGLDSGDNNMLRFLRKNNVDKGKVFSPSQINYEAVRRLAGAGITIHASFPLGSLGETPQSLENTIRFIERIAGDFGRTIVTLEASELVPLPYSPAWDMLLSRENSVFDFNGGIEATLEEAGIRLDERVKQELREKYGNQDLLDVSSTAQDWVRYFTHINWNDIERGKERADNVAKSIGAIYGRAI